MAVTDLGGHFPRPSCSWLSGSKIETASQRRLHRRVSLLTPVAPQSIGLNVSGLMCADTGGGQLGDRPPAGTTQTTNAVCPSQEGIWANRMPGPLHAPRKSPSSTTPILHSFPPPRRASEPLPMLGRLQTATLEDCRQYSARLTDSLGGDASTAAPGISALIFFFFPFSHSRRLALSGGFDNACRGSRPKSTYGRERPKKNRMEPRLHAEYPDDQCSSHPEAW